VRTNLNIRKGPSTGDKIIGKLSPNSYAIILGEENGWTKISTGTIKEGYVSSDYLFTPEEVMSLCDDDGLVSATINTKVLNVRSGPGTFYDVIDQVKKGSTYTVRLGKSYKGWIAIELKNGKIGYVSEKYVKYSYDMDTGLTLKELEELRKQEALAQAMATCRIYSIPETTNKPMTLTDEEYELFVLVIYNEACDEQYEGMLAVANVILNRMRNGHWGSTLKEVIFAPGQFEGAKMQYIERARTRKIPDNCFRAANEALAGRNNIGDYMFFRTTSSALKVYDYLTYYEFYILEDHVFYKKNW